MSFVGLATAASRFVVIVAPGRRERGDSAQGSRRPVLGQGGADRLEERLL